MTTLLSWLSVDARAPSALYIVADSRITWGSSLKRWDSGRKVFACRSADLFGYCGDVIFPSIALGQLADLIDRRTLWEDGTDAEGRHEIVLTHLKASSDRRHAVPDADFAIVHGARDDDGLASRYFLWCTRYNARHRRWTDTRVHLDGITGSQPLVLLGSGRRALLQELRKWQETPQAGTARSIFAAFCDSLTGGGDPLSGGLPQLVSLGRNEGGKVVGFISNGVRYLHGLPIPPLATLDEIEWVDSLFTRTSPASLERLSNAQRHARVENPPMGGLTAFLKRTGQAAPPEDD